MSIKSNRMMVQHFYETFDSPGAATYIIDADEIDRAPALARMDLDGDRYVLEDEVAHVVSSAMAAPAGSATRLAAERLIARCEIYRAKDDEASDPMSATNLAVGRRAARLGAILGGGAGLIAGAIGLAGGMTVLGALLTGGGVFLWLLIVTLFISTTRATHAASKEVHRTEHPLNVQAWHELIATLPPPAAVLKPPSRNDGVSLRG